jgi:hypothetical protein
MSEHVVIDHHHDTEAGVYRLCAGVPITDTRPMLDAAGNALLDDDNQPLTETVTVRYVDVVDVVFADADERWANLGATALAAEQRAIVDQAITTRDSAPGPAEVAELPGVGDPLAT